MGYVFLSREAFAPAEFHGNALARKTLKKAGQTAVSYLLNGGSALEKPDSDELKAGKPHD